MLRLMVPIGPRLGGRFGLPADLGEVIRASDGVTYWISSAKAERELGFHPRDLETGLRDWLLGEGSAPAPTGLPPHADGTTADSDGTAAPG